MAVSDTAVVNTDARRFQDFQGFAEILPVACPGCRVDLTTRLRRSVHIVMIRDSYRMHAGVPDVMVPLMEVYGACDT